MSEKFQLETKNGWIDVNEIERNKISSLCFIQKLRDEVELKTRKLVKMDSCFEVEDYEKLYPEVLEEWLVKKEKLKRIYADYNYKKDDKKPNKEKDERQAILHSFLPNDFYKFLFAKTNGKWRSENPDS